MTSVSELESSRRTYVGKGVGATLSAMWAIKRRPIDAILAWNYALAIIHGAAAIGFGGFFVSVFSKCSSRAPAGRELLPTTLYDHTDLGKCSKTLKISERAIAFAIVAFFAITSVFHIWYAVNSDNKYILAAKEGRMSLRWVEYGITATIMVGVIGITAGVRDTNAWFGLLAANAAMISTGAWWEATRSRTAIVIGFLLLSWIWTTIIRSFVQAYRSARRQGKRIPDFVWGAVFASLAWFSCFGLVPVFQASLGAKYTPWAVELTYILLSAGAKLTLASFVAWGLAARVNSGELAPAPVPE